MKKRGAYSLIFLSSKLTRRLEVDAGVRIVALIVFADVFDSVDMERYSKAMHRQDDHESEFCGQRISLNRLNINIQGASDVVAHPQGLRFLWRGRRSL